MKLRAIILWLLLTPIILVTLLRVGITLAQGIGHPFGYHVQEVGWEVAQELVAKNGSVDECGRIYWVYIPIGSPSVTEQQRLCRYEYAELARDPRACEKLLPSEYGLNCLGTVWATLSEKEACSSYQDGQILCGNGISGIKTGIENCIKYPNPTLQNWCYMMRSAQLENTNDCEKIPPEPAGLRQECTYLFAFKEKNEKFCSHIQDPRWQTLCKIRISAWHRYPELRHSSYFGGGK